MIKNAIAFIRLFLAKPSVKTQFERMLEQAEVVIEELKVPDAPKPKKPRKPRAKKSDSTLTK